MQPLAYQRPANLHGRWLMPRLGRLRERFRISN